jgi:MerR family transcriptional regulator, copper efflux regulator
MAALRIGEVARRAGVNLQTIHYYERRGLLPVPPRTGSNYRAYSEDAVLRVRFIKRAQELGFTLKEIEELLSLRVVPEACCANVRTRAEAKVRDIDEKVRALLAMRKILSGLIAECPSDAPVAQCPILMAFETQSGQACCESN